MAEGIVHIGPDHRDIIVIGASAGGLEPLQRVLADLPADLSAAVFVVIHMGATSFLAEILGRASTLPVRRASSGAAIEFGQIYVAVPGVHLLLHDNHVLLRRGPRENLARPAVDPLFRSAAATFGARVIGVVLSGSLNDGTAGIRAVKQCGGVVVVQHPTDAAYPSMPLSATRHTEIDYIVPANEMGELLARLTNEPAGVTPSIPFAIRLEAAIAAQEAGGMTAEDSLGAPSRFTCPECHGALWEIDDGSLLRYRCHVGHAFTAEAMLATQAEQAEELLWSLMRAHQERAALARRMAERERWQNRDNLARELLAKAEAYDEDAEVIRSLLRHDPNGHEQEQDGDEQGER
jgi:two-component system, chemotaxis family, protein-glutamate methylesterase/glutaminase